MRRAQLDANLSFSSASVFMGNEADFRDRVRHALAEARRDLVDRPSMLVPSLMEEGFVQGIEYLSGLIERELLAKGCFIQFRRGDQWSAEPFFTAFARRNKCQLGFIPRSHKAALSRSQELHSKYRSEFYEQWFAYLNSIGEPYRSREDIEVQDFEGIQINSPVEFEGELLGHVVGLATYGQTNYVTIERSSEDERIIRSNATFELSDGKLILLSGVYDLWGPRDSEPDQR